MRATDDTAKIGVFFGIADGCFVRYALLLSGTGCVQCDPQVARGTADSGGTKALCEVTADCRLTLYVSGGLRSHIDTQRQTCLHAPNHPPAYTHVHRNCGYSGSYRDA